MVMTIDDDDDEFDDDDDSPLSLLRHMHGAI